MRRTKILSIVAIMALLAAVVSPMVKTANAAILTTIRGTYNGTDTITVEMTHSATINGTVVEVTYDTAFGSHTGATLTNATYDATGSTDGFVRFVATGAVSGDIVISGLSTVPADGNYNVSVVEGVDYGAGIVPVALENEVEITAIVPPVIDLEIYDTTGALWANNGTNGENGPCNLGTLTPSQVKTCSYQIGVATNNTTGLNVNARDLGTNPGLYNSVAAVAMANVADGTVDSGEEYGFRVTTAGGLIADATTDTGISTATPGTLVGHTANVNGTINSIGTGPDAKTTITHSASMALNTPIGNYTQVVTYNAYTK